MSDSGSRAAQPNQAERTADTVEPQLERIQRTLEQMCAQQQEICARLERLERSRSREFGKPELIRFLDQFRAGEALGEASLGAWIAVSDTACVKGGLRTIQQREGMHARLLEARMKELGASPSFEIPQAIYDRAMSGAADPEKTDAQKVLDFVKRFPDIDAAVKPILDVADKLDHDPETQSLLRTIAQDERATLEFTHEACRLLNA
jgi:TolA-binding protein